ncbi:hypothetical protein NLI96_g508 [Meripilus lineatus]|uniref:Uncharacterized protein n=1 Tax=Meripilus lineatus TaxID=2056292 RepID=A0AAD5VC45_9APHY|nr:hypothetical protein NLI96_g508 [Physisporinus lineatus]
MASLRPSRLNFDILVNLFAFAESRGDVLSLMKTCRCLLAPATRHLFNFPVSLHHMEQTRSFCDYMLAKSQNRCRYLRHLRVLIFLLKDKDGPLLQKLAKVIQYSTRLEELVLQETEEFLSVGGDVVFSTLSDLTSHRALTKLQLGSVSTEASRLLEAMKATSVLELSLTFVSASLLDDPDPLELLAGLGPNLTTLYIDNALPYSDSEGVQCPNLHTLTLWSFGLLPLRCLTRMFPNLVNLSFHSEYGDEYGENQIEASRAENLAEYEADGGPWSSLQRLSGNIRQLYILGFSFHVKFLDLSMAVAEEAPMCIALIDNLSPNILDLSILVRTFKTLSELEAFLSRATSGLTQCTHLILSFTMDGVSFDLTDFQVSYPVSTISHQSWLTILNKAMLVSVLEKLTVHLLGIRIPCFTSRACLMLGLCEDVFDPSQCRPDPLETFLCAIDTKALATTIADRIPVLRHVGLHIGNQPGTSGLWEVVRLQGGESREEVVTSKINLNRACDFHEAEGIVYGSPDVGDTVSKN